VERGGISQEVKRAVWERCRGRCVECGSDALLEFDHVIPLALGGANTERNLQLLCADCNRAKGDGL
jgi:5-methylcytosine-specific restriction endonuclease McrA